jgi:hypothetical protein
MEAYEKSPGANISKFTNIYANQGKALNERKKALRNAKAFFNKLEILRSNYNSMKARKGRPGNKVNVVIWRNGKEKNIEVELKNKSGRAELENFPFQHREL